MTTIAYRDGVMAADRRAYAGGPHPVGMKVKVKRTRLGGLIGVSTAKVGEADRFCGLVNEQGSSLSLDDEIEVQALLVEPDGTVFFFNEGRCFSGPIDAEFLSIGSGEKYAYGALMMGASAQEAVEIACECDVYSQGPAMIWRVGDADSR